MKWLRRLVMLISALVLAGFAVFLLTGHELGPRPASSSAALQPASDVQFIAANGLDFAYIEQGVGPLVLMFHGYPETARSWAPVQSRLAAAGYRTVAVYMRGYPPTALATDYSLKALGQDVVGLIDAFGADKAIIIGHDWGASTVYEAAYIAPEKVSAVVAMSVPHPKAIVGNFGALIDAIHFIYYQSPFAERLVWSQNFAHVRKIYAAWSPGFEMPQAEVDDMIATFKVPGAINGALGYYRAFLANGADNSALGPDGEISVPTLVIGGATDGASSADLFDVAAPAFTGIYAQKILDGVGHFPQTEAPDDVADLIISFLANQGL